jgi:toxin ParE1/3/4
MAFRVLLTDDAVRDLEQICEYIAEHDSAKSANHVLDRIEEVVQSLATMPDRGHFPAELLSLGIREYGEVFFKPYRIVYRVVDDAVYVYLIADGRRDMQAVLARRLLGA